MKKAVAAIMVSLSLAGCLEMPPEEKWADALYSRCYVMGGHSFWDHKNHTVECYRHPIGRMTKTLFKETFHG